MRLRLRLDEKKRGGLGNARSSAGIILNKVVLVSLGPDLNWHDGVTHPRILKSQYLFVSSEKKVS